MFADIHPDTVRILDKPIDKETVLHEIVKTACTVHNISDCDGILSGVIDREAKLSTGIGLEIAVPHCLTDQVDHIILVPMLVRKGIDYNSVDGVPVKLLFLIISPKNNISAHINCLSTISHAISDETTRKKLLSAESSEELYKMLIAIKLWK
jgi:mannitol/fructose-specific phosphotransferase system IIA component (Ntr-type)